MSVSKPTNSKNYHFRYMLNGKIYSGSTKTTNKAAAEKFEAQHKLKIHSQIHLGVDEEITLKDALQKLLDAHPDSGHLITYAKKLIGSKYSTKIREEVKIFGFDPNTPFHTIRERDIQRLVQERRNEGNKNASLILELGLIGMTVKLMKRLGYLTPTLDIASIKKDNKITHDKKMIRFLTSAEEARLLAELDPNRTGSSIAKLGHSDEMVRMLQDSYDIVVLLLDLGTRYNEVAKLEWKNVSFSEGYIRVYRSKVHNESYLFMTDRVREILLRRSLTDSHQQFIFMDKSGNHKKYNPQSFKSACARAGLPGVTLHVLRKTFASRLAQAGVPLQQISSLLGHSTMVMTQAYAALMPNQSSMLAVEVLNNLNNTTHK